MRKCEAISWKKLEAEVIKQKEPEKYTDYPTSSKNPKNWDKIIADVTADEKNEKEEGDSALNS
jgi:hypothetical protein